MDVFVMKFLSSVISPTALQVDLVPLTINSMEKANPLDMLPFDDFLKKLEFFHEPSVIGEAADIVNLVENSNQPVYDFQELEVLHNKRLDEKEIATAISSQEIEI
ncbi:hypothetical protein [Vibrio harveyi]|uniref:hypothetical protein n=1 Tax=Vibrio harveyi TaxID=669 RepID=UPI00248025D8|nr:hypothetical protein [Vibrio harveyi]